MTKKKEGIKDFDELASCIFNLIRDVKNKDKSFSQKYSYATLLDDLVERHLPNDKEFRKHANKASKLLKRIRDDTEELAWVCGKLDELWWKRFA